ncbi:MAG: bifunctional diaminohydroxyphosphoribosylaminopyrimidine deaminase/5-amino-6-(5-phosphoribosylamino)uracil reductase RibD [Wolbachia endosymbiont of Menacanthus eurysternus]|nr:MAG: bifunctional diaminohydroxyphosphoribosylaminopyrimidine deaminase/5-amino-6-(5-phosphoribosylamino)uracil reductase RibD [Wolbachia endosymbiont of Menacanthus eurysternus]
MFYRMISFNEKSDDYFMSIALKLAKKILGSVAPNPAVGCVIVKNGVIIAEGNTGVGGRPHAEIVALQKAKNFACGATMYVTLEPCCHFGVTRPCIEKIIKAKIKRIVVATIDPDMRVSGGGIKALEEAGIEVEQGVMQKEAEKLNIGFFTTRKLCRPFIVCKVAITLDGKIASFTGDSKWITGDDTRNWVHKLRAKHDAIMIGSNTLIRDDPFLTCRLPTFMPNRQSPIRLIIDSQGKLKEWCNIAKTADKITTWIITNKKVEEKIKNINYLIVNSNSVGKVCLSDMTSKLALEIGITRLLVEGGGILITELMKKKLIDKLIICRTGKILGNDAIPFIGNLGIKSVDNCYQFKKIETINFNEDIVEIWV